MRQVNECYNVYADTQHEQFVLSPNMDFCFIADALFQSILTSVLDAGEWFEPFLRRFANL